jgi:hypothetical protein
MRADVLVLKGAGGGRRGILAALLLLLLLLCGDDGLQVLALPPLLAAVAVGCLRDLLRLVDGRLLDIGAIHRALPRHALGRRLEMRGVLGLRSGAREACGCAHRPGAGGGTRRICRRWPRAVRLWLHCTALRFLQLLVDGLSAPLAGPVAVRAPDWRRRGAGTDVMLGERDGSLACR